MDEDKNKTIETKNTFNVLDKLSIEDRAKLEEAVKTRGSNIVVLGKDKTGVTNTLCNILDLIDPSKRVTFIDRNDVKVQRNLVATTFPTDKPIDNHVLKIKPYALFMDSLCLFTNSLDTVKNAFMDGEISFISSVQLPESAENYPCNVRLNIKQFFARNCNGRFDVIGGSKILVVGLARNEGELTAYVKELQF